MSTYTVETIVHGYHVYRAVLEAAVGQVLPCQQERGNVHDPYAVNVAVDISSRHMLYATPTMHATPRKFAEKTFADGRKSTKSAKVFSLESFPLYGIP